MPEETVEQDTLGALCAFNKSVMIEECDEELPGMLDTWLGNREPDDRSGLHVSDFADPCLRRLFFKVTKPEVIDPKADIAAQGLFDIGHATHGWYQNRYFGPMGILKGEWMCPGCKSVVPGYMPLRDCTCTAGNAWEYQEPRVSTTIAGLPVEGHTDGIITVRGEDRVLEMKTKDSELFKDLTKPEPKHIVQGSIYAGLLGIKYIVILYIEKNKWLRKAFTMDTAPWALEWFVSSVTSLAKLIEMKDPMRVSPKCPHKNVVRAKRCAFRATCFPK